MPDEKALKTLFYRYWSPQGWTQRPIPTEDFEHARQAGVMFHDVGWTHDEVVERIRTSVTKLDPIQVAQQFVASLSSRRLDLRSALGSFTVGRLMPEHTHDGPSRCQVCGEYGRLLFHRDLNVLSFERHKWGGIRHLSPEYIAFDLECFITTDQIEPTDEDRAILAAILDTLRALPKGATPNDASRALTKVIRSNNPERRVLLEILGYCSVLETAEQPGFWRRFVTDAERPPYPGSKNDWSYPVAWWKGVWGVKEDAVRFFFPFL